MKFKRIAVVGSNQFNLMASNVGMLIIHSFSSAPQAANAATCEEFLSLIDFLSKKCVMFLK